MIKKKMSHIIFREIKVKEQQEVPRPKQKKHKHIDEIVVSRCDSLETGTQK